MTTPIQLTMGIEVPHTNQYLFSDHYLNNLLPTDLCSEDALPKTERFLAWLQHLYARETDMKVFGLGAGANLGNNH